MLMGTDCPRIDAGRGASYSTPDPVRFIVGQNRTSLCEGSCILPREILDCSRFMLTMLFT